MSTTTLEITPVRPDEWSAALKLALLQVPQAELPTRLQNALALLDAGEIDPRGIFVARTATSIVGVQVCIPLRGASGLFWLPQVEVAWQHSDLADRLVRAAQGWLRDQGAKLAQALLYPSDVPHAGPLLRAGLRHVTRLQYLRHELDDVAPLPRTPSLRLEAFAPAMAPVFQHTLLRTYDGTLDCPELNGVRTIDEILDGHRAQGIWHPDAWWLARWDDRPAGVLMLTELADGDGWDLSYVGVVPELRGRGLGRLLTQHALAAAQENGTARLYLAVDERNIPARRLYEAQGFQPTGCREVYLEVFGQEPSQKS